MSSSFRGHQTQKVRSRWIKPSSSKKFKESSHHQSATLPRSFYTRASVRNTDRQSIQSLYLYFYLLLFPLLNTLDVVGACAPNMLLSVRQMNQRLVCISCGTAPACSVNTTGPRGRGGSQAVIGQLPLRLMRERPVN